MKNLKKLFLIIIVFLFVGVIGIKATTLISSSQVIYKNNETVDVALNDLFDELKIGKDKIANAITEKGIKTSVNNTLEEMAHNISNISTISDNQKKLYESLKYSGLVTEEMSFDEILKVLSDKYPNITYIFDPSQGGPITEFSAVQDGSCSSYNISDSAITWSGCWHNRYNITPNNIYDLSSFNKLIVSGTANAGSTLIFTLMGQEGQGDVSIASFNSKFTLNEIDISNYTGKYKIRIWAYPTYENKDWYSNTLTYMILKA